MSSTGEILGGVGGAIAGFFVGGPMGAIQGASLGASLGGYIDPPSGPDLRGPTLDDATFQSSAYGVALPRTWGSIAVTGNVIYLENNEYKPVEETEQTGGKGGAPEGSYTTTTYFATFAVALGEARPDTEPRRIWAGGKLIYSDGSGDIDTTLASNNSKYRWRYYDGSQGAPDPRIESVLGVGNAPAYTGTAYLIFYDFELTEFGNGLSGAPIKVELAGARPNSYAVPVLKLNNDAPDGESIGRFKMPRGFSKNVGHVYVSPDEFPPTASQIDHYNAYEYAYDGRGGIIFTGGEERSKPGSNEEDDFSADVIFSISGDGPMDSYDWRLQSNSDNPDDFRLYIDSVTYNYPDEWPDDTSLIPSSQSMIAYRSSVGRIYLFVQGFEGVSVQGDGDNYVMRMGSEPHCSTQIVSEHLYVGDEYLAVIVSGSGNTVSVNLYDAVTLALSDQVTVSGLPGSQSAIRSNLWRGEGGDLFMLTRDSLAQGNRGLQVLNLTQGELAYSVDVGGTVIDSAGWVYSAQGGGIEVSLMSGTGRDFQIVVPMKVTEPSSAILSEVVASVLSGSGLEEAVYDVSELEAIELSGYRFSGPGSARGALGPLQVAYRFELIESGYQLLAALRGGSPIDSVAIDELDARPAGSAGGPMVSAQRDTDSRLPSRYTVRYLDYNREYDTNTQYADYPSRALNERTEDLPIVMTASDAAQTAEVLVNLAWMERTPYQVSLPQRLLNVSGGRKLLPGDVLSTELEAGRFVPVRIQTLDYADDQRLRATVRVAEPTAYTSSAVGQAADAPSETMGYPGYLGYALLDIPMVAQEFDTPGYAVTGWAGGQWVGASVLRSQDGGQSYQMVTGLDGAGTVARAINALPSGRDYFVIDRSNVLRCDLLAGEFESVTESQMLTGRNLCAYGADGRWEIMRFIAVDINSEGELEFTGLLGGLFGTEWAGELHRSDDLVILLDDPDVAPIQSSVEGIDQSLLFKVGRPGEDQQDLLPTDFVYEGVNLKPLSGVYPEAELNGNDWTISWIPRTRYDSTLWATGAEPPDESLRLYQVVILDGSEERRVIESDVATVAYTEAEQIADWGSLQSSLDVEIYQLSDRVGRGYVLTANFVD